MSKTWKRLLSLALAVCMILSLGMTGYADDGEEGTISLVPEEDQNEPAPAQEGEALESYALDPDTLHVPKLGQEDPETGAIALIDGEDAVDLNEVVRVSIFLDEPCALEAGYTVETAAEAGSYRDGLRARQDAMTAQIEGVIGHALNVHWNLTLAVNAISADLTLAEMEKVAEIPGIRAVQRENRYLPAEDTAEPNTAHTSENMVGALAAWEDGYTGAGSRVAIIDTGIDTAHQSFAEDPFNHAIAETGKTVNLMTRTELQGLASQLNSGSSNYLSAKIPYAYNYVDKNTTVNHLSDTQGEHGSHVAGIAAANRFLKSGSSYVDAASTVGAVGMAPDAQLLIMKVFGSSGGAYDSDYMVAIEDAIILQADVVNLSLGSGAPGFTFSNDYQDILNNLTNSEHNANMVVSISAGNAYDAAKMLSTGSLYAEDVNMHTGGSPGSFVNSLCVAAAQNTFTKGTPMNFTGVGDVFYYESTGNEEEGTTYTNPALTTITGSYSYVYIDAVGEADDYSAVNSAVTLSGKIVIVNRGSLSFVEKGENLKSYSPKALIVANNTDGTIYMDLTDFTGTFPMVTITLKDANLIKESGAAHSVNGITYYTGTVEVTNTEKEVVIDRPEATITDFSSWGVPGSLLMKPEITAPGGDIYSVAGSNKTNSGTAGGTDQYEYMSGTSMAAPHITGLTGVLAQYLRENPITNTALTGSFSTRAILQSLLMSTATPMKPGGVYLPILQQGAGLADVYKAIHAGSALMMSREDNTLTALTGAAADGKVKAEFGDDPARKGEYSYSFTLYNLTDTDQVYHLSTDLFTQDLFMNGEGLICMARSTVGLDPSQVSYTWSGAASPAEGHDVDMDGDTDKDDAQAILDYITGVKEEDEVDLDVADLDGDDFISSQDAYILLGWEAENPQSGYVLAANGTADVTVTIVLTQDDMDYLDEYYPGGAYIQGFTYVSTGSATREGESLETVHSIPLLGFYGSWTDATMFDTTSYAQYLYETGNHQTSYAGVANGNTNYLRIQLNGANVKFSGNPYMVEEEFPADRLAINSDTRMLDIAYNLVRSAGTTGFAVSKVDAEGYVTAVLASNVTGNGVTGLWFSQSSGSLQNTTTRLYSVNKTPAEYSLQEGDLFRVGFYAVPEYNGMLINDSYNESGSGNLDADGFRTLLTSGDLGRGAFVGYDFVVDNTDPVIGTASLNGSELTVTASDNEALAYVAVLSLDGETVYAEQAPGAPTASISLDASDAIANARGYVAVFAGDYAGNETARAIKVNDNGYEEKTVYVLTDTLTANNDYMIVSRNTAGSGYALSYTTTTSWSSTSNTVSTQSVTVKAGSSDTGNKPYIESSDAAEHSVWTASSGIKLTNGSNYLRRSSNTGTTLNISTTNSYNTWQYSNNQLRFTDRATYLRYSSGFSLTTTASSIYLYVKTTIRTEVDPYGVSSVTVTPGTLDLYRGSTADLTAKVLPLTASDRTVSWSSSDTSIATVDQTGHVTAVAAGTATITATANGDSTKSGSCTVEVVSVNKTLYGIVWDENGGVYFSNFNANSLPTWNKNHTAAKTDELHSAFMQSTSNLYAATLDGSSLESTLYTVNRTSYALTEVGPSFVGMMDSARGVTNTSYAGYVGMVYCFGPYIVGGNYSSKTVSLTDGSFTGVGIPYGMLDASETTGAYIAGVAARSVSTTSASYYLLDENGVIWTTTLSYSSSDGFVFSTPEKVLETGISCAFVYQSLYYDGTWLYWGHQTDDIAELILINPSTGKVYHAGNFGENVWPAVGLYVNGSVAPASVGAETEEIVPEPLDLMPVATLDELLTQDVIDRFAAAGFDISASSADKDPVEEPAEPAEEPVIEPEEPAEEPVIEPAEPVIEPVEEPVEEPAEEPAEEPVEEPVIEPAEPIEIPIDDPVAPVEETESIEPVYGSLQAFRGQVHSARVLITDDPVTAAGGDFNEEGEAIVTIPIAETEDSHNGLIAVDYEPGTMSLKGYTVSGNVSAASVFVDESEEKCIITIAYANRVDGGDADYLPAGTPIVELVFDVGCEDVLVCLTTLECNEDLEMDEFSDVNIAAGPHLWEDTPEWTWAEDYSSATATFTCQRDPEHTLELTDEAPASEISDGVITYTATVELDGETYTDTRTVEQKVTITFELNAVEQASVDPTSLQVTPGQPVGTLPTPTQENGWVFLGWFTEPASGLNVYVTGTRITEESTLAEDTTLYAHWRLPGDVNGDGKVNALDVALLSKYIRAHGNDVPIVYDSGNIDGSDDGKVNALDVALLSKYIRAHGNGVVIH